MGQQRVLSEAHRLHDIADVLYVYQELSSPLRTQDWNLNQLCHDQTNRWWRIVQTQEKVMKVG